jgi:molybdate transport system ATP-binding protein
MQEIWLDRVTAVIHDRVRLEEISLEMVLKLIDHLGKTGATQILYVTHHPEDHLSCITHHLELVPAPAGGYTAKG